MRIHSDKLTSSNLYDALDAIPGGDVYIFDGAVHHGSRKRNHGWEVLLRGTGVRHTRKPNYGRSGGPKNDDFDHAATYDDWGWYLARLFELDPHAIAGPYNGVADFNAQTRYQFIRQGVQS